MRILYIDESAAIGGAEEYLKILLKGFSQTFEITLVRPNTQHHEEFYRGLDIAQVSLEPVVYLNAHKLWSSYSGLFKTGRYDLLHVNLPAPNYCRAAIIAGSVCGVPRIVTTSHLPNLTFPRSALGMLAGRSVWDWLLWRTVFRCIDVSIVVSESSADSLLTNYPASPNRVRCIHNGVNVSRYAVDAKAAAKKTRELFGLSAQDLVVTSVGRLHPQKGFPFLLEAMHQVRKDVPNFKLVVVGDGPLRADLLKLVAELDLDGRVVLAGKRDDVPQILQASDIYVNSSLFEGLPFSILEAMAAGLPVVATAVDGNKEIVKDQENGMLVPAEDAGGLAKALTTLAIDDERRRFLGMQGKDTISKKFSMDRMLQKTEQLYRELEPGKK
jgi:glycosyltransferase involved in cell wall biosynthesis